MECRKYQVNLLLNVGPKENGLLRPIERETLLELGKWSKQYLDILRNLKPSKLQSDLGTVLQDDDYYYLVVNNVLMTANENVVRKQNPLTANLNTSKKIVNAKYIGDKSKVIIRDNSIQIKPFDYGYSLYTKIIRFKLK